MSTENVDSISPAQCRAARALLGMTQPELARMSRLGLSTVVDFERSRRQVSKDAEVALKNALETAGVLFIAANERGPGVRLRKPEPQS